MAWGSSLPDESNQKTGHRQDREYKEKYLADAHGTGGYATKAKQGSDQGNDKKHNGVMQHVWTPDVVSG